MYIRKKGVHNTAKAYTVKKKEIRISDTEGESCQFSLTKVKKKFKFIVTDSNPDFSRYQIL